MVNQKKILLRCTDNSVMVMSFIVDDEHELHRSGTSEEIEAEIQRSSSAWPTGRLPIVGWKEITDNEIPIDRSFRDAWVTQGEKIEHDMPKARAIHMDRIRAKRDVLLADMDGPWMRAIGQGDNVEAGKIEAQRQALRDIPDAWEAAIEDAESIEELGSMWPEEL